MKKILLIPFMLVTILAQAQDYNVTFKVNTSNIEVGPNGMYVGDGVLGGSDAFAMSDDDMDGIWEVTVSFEAGTAGNYAFFNSPTSSSDWGTKENLEAKSCGDADNYWNRILEPVNEDKTLVHCFASCFGNESGLCGSEYYDVTFSVNANEIEVGSNGMYVGGGVLGGSNAYPLSDNGSGTWSTTISLLEGTEGSYIFFNSPEGDSDWGTKENISGQPCANPDSFNDRYLEPISENTTLLHCWETCLTNGTCDVSSFLVTFSVNTANIEPDENGVTVGPNGMYAGGGFLGSATAVPLFDDDGDGIYVGSTFVNAGQSGNYVYLNSPNDPGDYNAKENLAGQSCADSDNWNDRFLPPVEQDTNLLHCFGSCAEGGECPEPAALMLQGIMDFTTPAPGGADGKAIHLVALEDIPDLSIFRMQTYANGQTVPYNTNAGGDLIGFNFPAVSANAGDHIIVARDIPAMEIYMDISNLYDLVLDGLGFPTANGNDAIELLVNDDSLEVFGVIGENPDTTGDGCSTDDCWDHEDAWAYKVNGQWIYAEVNCTDGTETICDATCVYPFASCSNEELAAYLVGGDGWRVMVESEGYRAVGPGGDAGFFKWWESPADYDVNYPDTGYATGLVDDVMYFNADGSFNYDTGIDESIMGKQVDIDAAFNFDGSIDGGYINGDQEYTNFPLADFSDSYTLGTDGVYDLIEFSTVGNLGMYTSTGAASYKVLETTENTMYVVMQGSETHYWYSLLTSEGTLSTNDNQLLEMRVFPNPVDANYISILSPIVGDKEIEIYTLTGRKVLQTTISNSILNIEFLTAGFYMIKVAIDGMSKTSKLVVR